MTKQNRRTRSFTHGFVASPDGEHGIGQIAFVHYLQWSGYALGISGNGGQDTASALSHPPRCSLQCNPCMHVFFSKSVFVLFSCARESASRERQTKACHTPRDERIFHAMATLRHAVTNDWRAAHKRFTACMSCYMQTVSLKSNMRIPNRTISTSWSLKDLHICGS